MIKYLYRSLLIFCLGTLPLFGASSSLKSFPFYNLSVFVDLTQNGPYAPIFGPDLNCEGIISGIPPDDHLYVTRIFHGSIFKIDPQGVLSLYASLPDLPGAQSTGLDFDKDGNLFVAFFHAVNNVPTAANGVYKIPKNNPAVPVKVFPLHGEYLFEPDGLAVDKFGNVYVSDPASGNIWKFDSSNYLNSPGVIWAGTDANSNPNYLQGLGILGPVGSPYNPLGRGFGVNDLTIDKQSNTMYCVNGDTALLVQIPINPDGSAGIQEVLHSDTLSYIYDGISFDKDKVYWTGLVQLLPTGIMSGRRVFGLDLKSYPMEFSTLFVDNIVGTPSDVVTGRGFGEDHPKDLYISNIGAPGVEPLTGPYIIRAQAQTSCSMTHSAPVKR